MGFDYIVISSTPVGEKCEQLGPNYDPAKARKECEVFREQLRREFGKEPEGAKLRVKSFAHEFGNYMEVVCYFDEHNEDAVNYAFKLEGETPENWDEEAKKELGLV